jgi:transposase-like protein
MTMTQTRNRYSGTLKFRLALEAAKEQQTLNELSCAHGVHPNQIGQWKRQLLEEGPTLFDRPGAARQHREQTAREAELYEQIGRLQMELEWVKKKAAPFS